MLDDGECSVMPRKLVAKGQSESNRVTGTLGSRVASWASGVETSRWGVGVAVRVPGARRLIWNLGTHEFRHNFTIFFTESYT